MADEVLRRVVHASGAVIPGLWLTDLLTWQQIRMLLVAGVVLAVVLEAIRLVIGLNWELFDRLTREYEQDNPAGYALYVFSGSITGLVFQPEIAVPAMLMLTLADPVAGLLSTNELRTIKHPRVLTVMFGLCAGIAVAFVSPPAAILGGLAAMLADGVKPQIAGYVIDDNLTIPIVAGTAMFIGVTYLPTISL